MTVPTIQTAMQRLQNAGLRVTLTPEKGIKVSPASAITDAMRTWIVKYKIGIIAYLRDAANDPASPPDRAAAALDPDRHCWSHSPDMSTAEIGAFTARLARFTDRGQTLGDAECLADRLALRDREQDDRAVCMECSHLHRAGRCGNWQRAGVAVRAWDAQLAGDFVNLLQRCDGFTQSIHFHQLGGNHGQA